MSSWLYPDLATDRADLAVFRLSRLDEACHVDEEFAVKVRPACAVPAEQIVARLGRGFRGRTRGDVGDRDVVDSDLDVVLLTPVLCERIEPLVVLRDEVAPLHDGEGFVVGKRAGDEWCSDGRHRSGGNGNTGLFQETASRDSQMFARAHLESSCGCGQLGEGSSR